MKLFEFYDGELIEKIFKLKLRSLLNKKLLIFEEIL